MIHDLQTIYGDEAAASERQRARYTRLAEQFRTVFGRQGGCFVRAPGRIEIGGNHTDHSGGWVLGASTVRDTIACAAANQSNEAVIVSRGYSEPFRVNLTDLEPRTGERETTTALLRGVLAALAQAGYEYGGFDACLDSDLPAGSGLSSSAALEVMLAQVVNALFNNLTIPPLDLALAGKQAENEYFGKPCGLLDQTLAAVGGLLLMDFNQEDEPGLTPLESGCARSGLAWLVVHTGGSHADLTSLYAEIPAEIGAVAAKLGAARARDVASSALLQQLPGLRESCGDRAVARMLHFLAENERVREQASSLQAGNMPRFLELVRASGISSRCLLQNSHPAAAVEQQPLTLALGLTEQFLGTTGTCRVHGGGFAGTILVILPPERLPEYERLLEPVFGEKCITQVTIGDIGAAGINLPAAQF